MSFHTVNGQSISSDTTTESSNQKIATDIYAYDDFARLKEDDTISINILSNDIGLNEGVKNLNFTLNPKHGSIDINKDNSILYTPNRSYYGVDSLVYEVCNNSNNCATAKLLINIENINFIPITINDTVIYIHNKAITIPVLKNDTIKGDIPNIVSITTNINNGNCYVDENRQIVPIFNRLFSGKDSLEYSLCDNDGDCSYASVIFYVKQQEEFNFFIPTGFSPNGDGINDNFYIPDFYSYTNINAQILDETGRIVFQEDPYQNNWNGVANRSRMKGQPLPSGTYYYIFSVKEADKILTGYVYLSR